MKNKITFILFFFVFACSCAKEKEELPVGQKEGTGTVWVSGGLFFCHSQIRMENGEILIPMEDGNNIYPYSMGQKVRIIYEELTDIDPGCTEGIACKIIKTNLIE